MSREVADRFIEALWRLEEDRDVEPLIEVHAEDCRVGNVAVPRTFDGHEGLREFWTSYRNTFDEIEVRVPQRLRGQGRSRRAGVDDRRHLQRRYHLLRGCEHPGYRGR